jgi:hypothetical protein
MLRTFCLRHLIAKYWPANIKFPVDLETPIDDFPEWVFTNFQKSVNLVLNNDDQIGIKETPRN